MFVLCENTVTLKQYEEPTMDRHLILNTLLSDGVFILQVKYPYMFITKLIVFI